MADYSTQASRRLETLLPMLIEKEKAGLILPSVEKAKSLIEWSKHRPYTEKQELLIGRLIVRAERKHAKGKMDMSKFNFDNGKGGEIDVNDIVATVLDRLDAPDIDDIAAKVIAKIGKENDGQVSAVVEAVMERLDKRVPRKVEVTVKHADGKVVKLKDQPRHKEFEHLLKAATARMPNGFAPGIFLAGEASSGKTTGAHQLAEALGLEWRFNGAISFPHEMLGFIDGAGKYHRTPFRDAYEHGGVYTFDEVDRSDPVALLAVNPHLANGVATFPDKQIKRHKDCIIVCTANTWGLGADASYSGATKLDAAFLSRFPVRINWDIDPALEEKIVANPAWLARVRAARTKARAAGLKVLIDTRAAQAGVALIKAGYTMDEAAKMTYLANLKPEQRKQIEVQ